MGTRLELGNIELAHLSEHPRVKVTSTAVALKFSGHSNCIPPLIAGHLDLEKYRPLNTA
jgi:hypothetical protein